MRRHSHHQVYAVGRRAPPQQPTTPPSAAHILDDDRLTERAPDDQRDRPRDQIDAPPGCTGAMILIV
jgi:hypothetical protein